MTTYYAEYSGMQLTLRERGDGAYIVRCARGAPKNAGLLVGINETLTLTNKRGEQKLLVGVEAFEQRIQYGMFTRTCVIVPSFVENLH
jgi:hypothetical protein